MDLRQNQRGRFLKVTMLAGNKTFVAIPGESLATFRDSLASILDNNVTEGEGRDEGGEGGGGGGEGRSRPPPQRTREQRSPQTVTKVLPSKEVRAGAKRFYFDVEQNDRGTFIKLTEVNCELGWYGYCVGVRLPGGVVTTLEFNFHAPFGSHRVSQLLFCSG